MRTFRTTTTILTAVLVLSLGSVAPLTARTNDPLLSTGELRLDFSALAAAGAGPLDRADDDVSSRSGAARVGVGRVVPVGRVAGDGRLETAVAIAGRSFPEGSGVAYVARADALADALAAGTLTDGPILLVPSCGPVPAVVAAEVDRLDPDVVVGLGGEAAVCGDMLTGVAGGREVDRIAGQDRFDTAIRVAQRGFDGGAGSVYVANGADSPDAVAGGALTDGPILLVPPGGGILPTVAEEVARISPERVVALGGTGVVSDGQLTAAAGGVPTGRLSGVNRFATSVAIATEEFGDSPPVVYLARGDVFADAVASGSLTDGPVVLVPQCGGLPAEVVEYLEGVATSQVIALGGQAAVCDEILNAAAALPTLDEDPTPPPPPGPGPGEPDDLGTLYYSGYGELMAIDMTTLGPRQLRYAYGILDTFRVNLDAREFVYIDDEFISGSVGTRHHLQFRDLDTTASTGRFEWLGSVEDDATLNPDHFPEKPLPSPDGELVIARVYYRSGFDFQTVIEVKDRTGATVALFDGGSPVGGGGAFSHYAWTPEGDLLVVIDSAEDANALEEGAVLGLIDADELSAVTSVTVLAEFAGDGQVPSSMAVSNSGEELAYAFDGDLWIMPFEAGGEAHRIARGPHDLMWPTFAPDDSAIVLRNLISPQGGFSPSVEDTHIIANHRGAPVLIEQGGATELRVPEAGGSGVPSRVDAKGPYVWDPVAP